MILDNADNPDLDYQPYIPANPSGVVIVTSRNDECHQYATAEALVLEGLSADAARELLLKAAHVPAIQRSALAADADKVVGLLHSHPLALIQAGAYVSRGHCRLGQYPDVYERQRQRLFQFRPAHAQSRYRDTYATFEASVDAIKQLTTTTSGDALTLLPLLATCGADQIPLIIFEASWQGAKTTISSYGGDAEDCEVQLLTPWHIDQMPPFLGLNQDAWDSFRLLEALQMLKAFAVVSIGKFDEAVNVSIHPLVHAWARDRQSDDEQRKSRLTMVCILACARQGGILKQNHDW